MPRYYRKRRGSKIARAFKAGIRKGKRLARSKRRRNRYAGRIGRRMS